jgi:hypothetical protein
MKKQSAPMARWLVPVALVCLLTVEMGIALQVSTQDTFLPSHSDILSRLSGTRFAIADFDGDWKPDLALVETANFRRVQANYAIHLQLSAGSDLSFLIDAPDGGVRVAARDVNGDSFPDVVVSSVSDERVVAILLNDGHGKFSRAEPSSYLGIATDPDLFLHSCDQSVCDQFTVASLRYSFDGDGTQGAAEFTSLTTDSVVLPEIPEQSAAEFNSSRGRSPPLFCFSLLMIP